VGVGVGLTTLSFTRRSSVEEENKESWHCEFKIKGVCHSMPFSKRSTVLWHGPHGSMLAKCTVHGESFGGDANHNSTGVSHRR
jgi:hypothetical protein